jgi:hypothetical protein
MWTAVNQVYATHHGQNAWAHLANGNAWRKIAPNAADGVTNAFVMLVAAKANAKQVYVVLNGAGQITEVYL